MKVVFLFVCILCTAACSILAVLYAKMDTPPTPTPGTPSAAPAALLENRGLPEKNRAVEDLLKEVIARQETLDRQKVQLDEREAQIRQEEILLTKMRDELNTAEQTLQAHFKELDTKELSNMRKLSEFYAKMDPQNAARLLTEIDGEQAARIITLLQDRQAGAIMDAAVALGATGIERAVLWSEQIRQQKNQAAKKATEKATP